MWPVTVLVVCNGNIHRSVIAEICLNEKLRERQLENKIVCISRGLEKREGKCRMMDFPAEWSLTKSALDELGIVVPEERVAQQINAEIIDEAWIILAMDRRVFSVLKERFPQCQSKKWLFTYLGCSDDEPPDIMDLKGETDPELHYRTNRRIKWIARNGIHRLCGLITFIWSNQQGFPYANDLS